VRKRWIAAGLALALVIGTARHLIMAALPDQASGEARLAVAVTYDPRPPWPYRAVWYLLRWLE